MDYYYYDLLVTLVWIVALIVFALMLIRYQTNKMNMRERIVTAMIEKNPDADIDELLKKVAPKKRLLKEKLLTKLLWGCILSFLGLGIFGCGLWMDWHGGVPVGDLFMFYSISAILFAIGIAFFINYMISKKMLAKEIEAEEKQLVEEA